MVIRLSAVMLLMGVGMSEDVKDCGKIRILGLYLQDTQANFVPCLMPKTKPFVNEVSDFMDKADLVYPGSMFGVYGFKDRFYNNNESTTVQDGDYQKTTSLVDVSTAKTQIKTFAADAAGGGKHSAAFDVMYHLIVNGSDSGIDSVPPLSDTYDAKVLYVFSDGIPSYLESTYDSCLLTKDTLGFSCFDWCRDTGSTKCCEYDPATGKYTPLTSKVDYGSAWNSTAECPIDLATLGKKINDNDWYVAYINAGGDANHAGYNWSKQVSMMGIESRFTTCDVDYDYKGLKNRLVDITSKIMCSAVPSNNPSGIPTGVPTTVPSGGGGDESCGARVQYVHTQDLTGSFGDDIKNVQKLLPEALQGLADTYPGSLFGLTKFYDKTDPSCYELTTGLTTDLTKVTDALKTMVSGNGGDTPEDSLGAVWSILRGDKSDPKLAGVTWAPPETGVTDVKIIGIATDVGGHYKDDASFYMSPAWFVANDTCTGQCKCPYMDPADVGKAIIDDDIYILVMAAGLGMPGMTTSQIWEKLFDMMGITDRGVIVNLTADSSNLFDVIIDSIAHISCDIATTTGGPTVAPTGASTVPPTGSTESRTGAGGTTTTTTTKKPFPVGLVAGCAAGALAAAAAAAVAAQAMRGTPAPMEFEFEGEEGAGHEEVERETQVALGETDFA